MTVEISPVTDPADFPRLAEIRAKAFAGSRIDELCYPNTTVEDHVVSISRLMTKLMDDPKVAVWKATKDGEIVGLATWSVPHEYDAAEKEKEAKKKANETPEERLERLKERFPAGTNYLLADEFFSSLDLGIKEPHYHLGILVVDPKIQRSGAGSALLRWGSERADKEGVDCYLEATTAGIPLYERYGYERFRDPIRGGPDQSMVLYPMRRQPLRVRTARKDELPVLARLHREAFTPTKWYSSLWGKCKPEAFEAWILRQIESWSRIESDELVVAVRGDQILGYAQWEQKSGPQEWKEDQSGSLGDAHPEGTNVEVANNFSRDMGRYNASVKGHYWHLHILATSPQYQRSGAGKKLIEFGTKRAQEQGKPVYLEGGDEAMAFYQRLGFQVCGEPIAGICGSFQDTPLVLHPITIAEAKPSDIPTLATVHREAFMSSSLYQQLFGSCTAEAVDAWNEKRMRAWFAELDNSNESTEEHWTMLARRGEQTLCYGHWTVERQRPSSSESKSTSDEPKPDRQWPEGTNTDMAEQMWTAMEAHEKLIDGPHAMLHQLASSPRYQKTGAGRALLRRGLEKCREEGLDMYLDATPAGRPLYDSEGFESWSEPLDVLPGCELFPMRRRCTKSEE